jgi:hypothetical protein
MESTSSLPNRNARLHSGIPWSLGLFLLWIPTLHIVISEIMRAMSEDLNIEVPRSEGVI